MIMPAAGLAIEASAALVARCIDFLVLVRDWVLCTMLLSDLGYPVLDGRENVIVYINSSGTRPLTTDPNMC